MPSPSSVRRSRSRRVRHDVVDAAAASTWSPVSSGLGRSAIGSAISLAIPAGTGSSGLLRPASSKDHPQQLLLRHGLRPADLIGPARPHLALAPPSRTPGRRRPHRPAGTCDLPPISGITGKNRDSDAISVEEAVVGPKDQRRPDDDGVREGFPHRRLALGPRAGKGALRLGVGAEHRHVDQRRRARRLRRLRDIGRAIDVHRREPLVAALIADGDEVDHDARAAHRARDRVRIARYWPASERSARRRRAA